MASVRDDAGPIKANGWRQGSVLPHSLVESLRNGNCVPERLADCELWIVVSHDCDVTNPRFSVEPNVEIVPARRMSGSDGNKHWGKSPREFQFDVKIDGGEQTFFDICVHDRLVLSRQILLDCLPDDSRQPSERFLRAISHWLSKRYVRAAFPDAFNDRTRDAAIRLRQSFKKSGHLIEGIYMVVVDDELEEDETYKIIVYAVMHDDEYASSSSRKAAQLLVDQVESRLSGCEGVTVEIACLKPEAEITLSDLRLLKRWDFDYLSLRDPDSEDLPRH